ncbi:MAG: RING finger domain-containing protein [Chlamydiales bacterium]
MALPATSPASNSSSPSGSSVIECSICLENIHPQPKNEAERARALKCYHVFHDECIGEWINQRPNCPMCRADIEPCVKETTEAPMSKVPSDKPKCCDKSAAVESEELKTKKSVDEPKCCVKPVVVASEDLKPKKSVDEPSYDTDWESYNATMSLVRGNIVRIRQLRRLDLNENTPVAHTARTVNAMAVSFFGFGR